MGFLWWRFYVLGVMSSVGRLVYSVFTETTLDYFQGFFTVVRVGNLVFFCVFRGLLGEIGLRSCLGRAS
jgi:hypothetical protein